MKDAQGRTMSHPFEALTEVSRRAMVQAFGSYLKQFTPREIADAEVGSPVQLNLANYNRLRNLFLGSHVEHNLTYIPMTIGGTGSARDAFGGYTGCV